MLKTEISVDLKLITEYGYYHGVKIGNEEFKIVYRDDESNQELSIDFASLEEMEELAKIMLRAIKISKQLD